MFPEFSPCKFIIIVEPINGVKYNPFLSLYTYIPLHTYWVTLHAKMAMPDLQRYPWHLCLIKYDLVIHCPYFCFFKLFIFICSAHFLLIWSNGNVSVRFQGDCCKSGISHFAWRVTWNNAYSPSKNYLFQGDRNDYFVNDEVVGSGGGGYQRKAPPAHSGICLFYSL